MHIERRVADLNFKCEQHHRHNHQVDGAEKKPAPASPVSRYSKIIADKFRIKATAEKVWFTARRRKL